MHEEHRVGIHYLEEVTALLQRVRAAHPTAGVYEAADFQWWWRIRRSTDVLPQLFWFDEAGRSEAAVIATDWGNSVSLYPIVLPDAVADWIAHVVERGLAHAGELGLDEVDVVIDRTDQVMAGALAAQGYTTMDDELVDSWIDATRRPAISPLHADYRMASRLDTLSALHHLVGRNGPGVEDRLNQTSLYRADLDLAVLDGDDRVAAYGLFWFDPETSTGLVEPMRTEDEHQRRGLARHVLTTGLNLLLDAGADRIKIAWDRNNLAAHNLYTDVGFETVRHCAVVSRPTED
ncbi:MAG TPA: GNAT family N-acetyltransferase [Acidimicrobiia bacterium]|nr:GNAT family N-acetyltransferase [Acidimicrobiia bacterium]